MRAVLGVEPFFVEEGDFGGIGDDDVPAGRWLLAAAPRRKDEGELKERTAGIFLIHPPYCKNPMWVPRPCSVSLDQTDQLHRAACLGVSGTSARSAPPPSTPRSGAFRKIWTSQGRPWERFS